MRSLPPSPASSSPAVAAVMRGNKGRDTRPELALRRLLHVAGYRYRRHLASLPGKPDVCFPARKKAIFVHGCFWHQHMSDHCPLRSRPRSNAFYWTPKLRRNVHRDERQATELCAMGWKLQVVWECEMSDSPAVHRRLTRYLGPPRLKMRRNEAARARGRYGIS
jgi:DNA mismatch endonuclease (patch repair protein)